MGIKSRVRVKGAQYGLDIGASAVRLNVPELANVAEVYVHTADISFTRDGTTPTATKGFIAHDDDIIHLNSRDELDRFQAIRVTGSATVDVEFFTDVSG